MSRRLATAVFFSLATAAASGACAQPMPSAPPAASTPEAKSPAVGAPDARAGDANATNATPSDAAAPSVEPDDPMDLHRMAPEELASLMTLPPKPDGSPGLPGPFLKWVFEPTPGRFNQGNKARARHEIGKRACEANLRKSGVVIQTPEQRARCGAENMVPVWRGGDPQKGAFCIDTFEFPNRPCELPMVWGSPSQAVKICAAQGKRLCAQDEWNLACGGDPAGGPPTVYAYGNDLDLDACNTQKPHDYKDGGPEWTCLVRTAQTAWATCATETEPAGSFPRCRSRFGVFDQHGNVAEMMTRKAGHSDPTSASGTVTQLKGSAFFYVDVARQHDRPHPKDARHDTYPDHCNYDPRWHVEPIENAFHVNYHLGFRCCKSLP